MEGGTCGAIVAKKEVTNSHKPIFLNNFRIENSSEFIDKENNEEDVTPFDENVTHLLDVETEAEYTIAIDIKESIIESTVTKNHKSYCYRRPNCRQSCYYPSCYRTIYPH